MMTVVATARQGFVIGLFYALSLTGLPLYAEEPKSAPPKPAEQSKEKSAEQSKEPAKTPEKASEPKELVILEGSAHAQFIFTTDQGERLMREILRFLSAP